MTSQIKFNRLTGEFIAFDKAISVTNVVRNELGKSNNFRALNEVVYSEALDGKKGPAYYPRTFPSGNWLIKNIIDHPDQIRDAYLYPFFIATNAHQLVQTREVVDGKYAEIDGLVEDYGYGIHHSTSRTTLGCIKVIEETDLRWLVDQIKASWHNNEVVRMEVV